MFKRIFSHLKNLKIVQNSSATQRNETEANLWHEEKTIVYRNRERSWQSTNNCRHRMVGFCEYSESRISFHNWLSVVKLAVIRADFWTIWTWTMAFLDRLNMSEGSSNPKATDALERILWFSEEPPIHKSEQETIKWQKLKTFWFSQSRISKNY